MLKEGTRCTIPCLAAILPYNRYMGCINHGKQIRMWILQSRNKKQDILQVLNYKLSAGHHDTKTFIVYYLDNPGTKLNILKLRKVLEKQLIENL